MSLYNLQILRDTLWEQIVLASGLSEDDVIWYTQAGSRPSSELSKLWVGLNLLSMTPVNQLPYFSIYDTPGTPPPGTEITLETTEHLEIMFSIHVFSSNLVGGDGQAPFYMHKIRSYLGRDNTNIVFAGIHAAIVDRGPILHIPTVLNTKYESRANMALKVRVATGDLETTTYIETVGPVPTDFVNGET